MIEWKVKEERKEKRRVGRMNYIIKKNVRTKVNKHTTTLFMTVAFSDG